LKEDKQIGNRTFLQTIVDFFSGRWELVWEKGKPKLKQAPGWENTLNFQEETRRSMSGNKVKIDLTEDQIAFPDTCPICGAPGYEGVPVAFECVYRFGVFGVYRSFMTVHCTIKYCLNHKNEILEKRRQEGFRGFSAWNNRNRSITFLCDRIDYAQILNKLNKGSRLY
jgi:hypothetical protein